MKKKIIIDGSRLSYEDVGNGAPAILLHGFGEKGDVWHQQVEYLQADFRLIIPDLPGSGDSDFIDDMTMEGLAAFVHQLMDAEGIARAVMIGHSMGGYITLAFAAKYPQALSAFGLFSSSAFADSEEKKATRRKGIAFIGEHGAFAFLKTSTPKLFSKMTADERPGLIDGFVNSLSNFSPQSLVLYYEAMIKRPERTEVLSESSVPVLFILGEHDTAIPLADGLKLCQLPKNSYIHILARSGHMGMLEEAEKSNKILHQFLSEVGIS